MDRLTTRIRGPLTVLVRGKAIGPAYFSSESEYEDYLDALNRLAAYEDTGLTPEELDDFARQACEIRMAAGCKTLKDCYKLVKEDRLLVLPCKVGDTVYYIDGYKSYKAKAHTFRFNESGVRVYCKRNFMGCIGFEGIYGKTVFLTREEAEKALEGMG